MTISIDLSTGRKHRGRIKSVKYSWPELIEKLSDPFISAETVKEYRAASTDERSRLKAQAGFAQGGLFKDGERKVRQMISRTIITLDIDEPRASLLDELELGATEVSKHEFFLHTTRSHTPEKPKFRIWMPVSRPMAMDEYQAITRYLAWHIDPTMDSVDDVSFRPAQIMYWPSVCKDGEFVKIHNSGRVLNVDATLDMIDFDRGDWRDQRNWPFSAKRGAKRIVDSHRKPENPREKPGVIGAFCRVYGPVEAIDAFLSDIYVPSEEAGQDVRYSYVGGSTSNGLVIYDDFAYSHHGSDPCADRLVNSFDMVRLHLYGDLDIDVEPEILEKSPGKAPSFIAMSEMAEAIEAVKVEMVQQNYDPTAMFEDLSAASEDDEDEDAAPPTSEWMKKLNLGRGGVIKSDMYNASVIMVNDPRFKGAIRYNEMTQDIVAARKIKSSLSLLVQKPIEDAINGDHWDDSRDHEVRVLLEAPRGKKMAGYGLKLSKQDLEGGVLTAAKHDSFHPVRDYLNSLLWDGAPRMADIFVEHLGAEDDEYTRETARISLIAAVARAFEPGCKWDYMPILEGAQGMRKSSFIRALGKGWYGEYDGKFSKTQELVERTSGSWIVEIPELNGFSRAEVGELKSSLSIQSDKIRKAYGRRAQVFARQFVFFGTTNDSEYLRDDTGGRRFFPIKCNVASVDVEAFEKQVDQIWAEAYQAYRALRKAQPFGLLPLYLRGKAAETALTTQEDRRVETADDAALGQISAWLDAPPTEMFGEPEPIEEICALQVWIEVIGGTPESYGRNHQLRMSRIMRRIPGWHSAGLALTKKYGRQRVYRRDKNR